MVHRDCTAVRCCSELDVPACQDTPAVCTPTCAERHPYCNTIASTLNGNTQGQQGSGVLTAKQQSTDQCHLSSLTTKPFKKQAILLWVLYHDPTEHIKGASIVHFLSVWLLALHLICLCRERVQMQVDCMQFEQLTSPACLPPTASQPRSPQMQSCHSCHACF